MQFYLVFSSPLCSQFFGQRKMINSCLSWIGSCQIGDNIAMRSIKPAAVSILAIFTRPVSGNTAEIANGRIIFQVMAYASAVVSC